MQSGLLSHFPWGVSVVLVGWDWRVLPISSCVDCFIVDGWLLFGRRTTHHEKHWGLPRIQTRCARLFILTTRCYFRKNTACQEKPDFPDTHGGILESVGDLWSLEGSNFRQQRNANRWCVRRFSKIKWKGLGANESRNFYFHNSFLWLIVKVDRDNFITCYLRFFKSPTVSVDRQKFMKKLVYSVYELKREVELCGQL